MDATATRQFAQEDRSRVFEESYQIRGAGRSGIRCTGLGLPYAQRLVTLLDGELTLDSTIREGSTFAVTLPLQIGPG